MEQQIFQYSRYTQRMLLTAADLENQRAYDNEKRLLLNRMLWGKGVWQGLDAASRDGGIVVSPGLALDARGRELYLERERFLPLQALFPQSPTGRESWFLCMRYGERLCGAGTVLAESGIQEGKANRVAEEVRFLALRAPGADEVTLSRLEFRLDALGHPAVEVFPAKSRPERRDHSLRREQAQGVIRLDTAGADGYTWYSRETPHTLGAGAVRIGLGVEGYKNGRSCLFSGDTQLFGCRMKTAVQIFTGSGTFIAAARMESPAPHAPIVLRWWAERCETGARQQALFGEEDAPPPEEPCRKEDVPAGFSAEADDPMPAPLRLEPAVALLSPGERMVFTLLGGDGAAKRACRFWAQAGEIDETGAYIAPEREGCFSIRAFDARDPAHPVNALAMVYRRR